MKTRTLNLILPVLAVGVVLAGVAVQQRRIHAGPANARYIDGSLVLPDERDQPPKPLEIKFPETLLPCGHPETGVSPGIMRDVHYCAYGHRFTPGSVGWSVAPGSRPLAAP